MRRGSLLSLPICDCPGFEFGRGCRSGTRWRPTYREYGPKQLHARNGIFAARTELSLDAIFHTEITRFRCTHCTRFRGYMPRPAPLRA